MDRLTDLFESLHLFIDQNLISKLDNKNFIHDLTPLSLGILSSVIAIITTCLLYSCISCLLCRRNVKKKQAVRVFGRVKDITVHSGGGKKKCFSNDPFRLSNLDFQRRFENEMTLFLYLLSTECVPVNEMTHINFYDLDNKISSEPKYILEYRWLLRHYAMNSRDYGHIFVKSKFSRQEISQCKDPGWTVEELLAELNTNEGVGSQSVEVIVSWACRFRDLCNGLRDKLNKSINNFGYLQEVTDETRMRENVMSVMGEGVMLIELIKAAISPLPKSLKDHYHNIISLQRIYRDEYIPFVSLSRNNKRKFDKLDHLGTVREIMLQQMEEILTKGGEDTLDIMATVVLPRFNSHIEQ